MAALATLPPGFLAFPVDASPGGVFWPLCLVVREAGAGSFELVILHNLPDCRAFLGCVCDGEGGVRDWLEFWVQNLEDFSAGDISSESEVSSIVLDHRWERHWMATRAISPGAIAWRPPPESVRPLWFDAAAMRFLVPALPDGGQWCLCRDDSKLAAVGLPRYSESTRRCLVAQLPDGSPRFVSAERDTSPGEAAPVRSPESGFSPAWIPFNPQGAPMVARLHPVLDFEDYLDLLNGATVAEVGARKKVIENDILSATLNPAGHDGRRHGFLLSRDNPHEIIYLKLRLLHQAGQALMTHLRQQQVPLLNLEPASFGVFTPGGGDLPWPWLAICELVRPGRAVPLQVPGTDETRYVTKGDSEASAYCPAGLSRRTDRNAQIRLLGVDLDDERRRVRLEGTITGSTDIHVAASDIVRFRLPEISGEFYGSISAGSGSGIQFRTWPRSCDSSAIAQFQRSKGGLFGRCWFQLIPALSSPYDLYSFAMLGVRALLCQNQQQLPERVNALDRLGRSLAAGAGEKTGFGDVVTLVERELGQDDATRLVPDDLLGVLPERMKAEVVALLLRLMPGLGPVSHCADFGSAPNAGLHVALEEPLEMLESLCARARSLVFSDWDSNREVRGILAQLREGR